MTIARETSRWVLGVPARTWTASVVSFLPAICLAAIVTATLIVWRATATPGGPAWVPYYRRRHRKPAPAIPGPRGLPVLGSLLALSSPGALPHRILATYASGIPGGRRLMAFSIGSTPAVVTSDPAVAREILSHPNFADRPLKHSARLLMFRRAIGFAPSGAYWRLLRGFAASHLFSPRCIAAQAPGRSADCAAMVRDIAAEQASEGRVCLRRHLQGTALNNMMGSVFGCRYDFSWKDDGSEPAEVTELRSMVREGFELLGAFNWSDHLPWLGKFYDPDRVVPRCAVLVPRVRGFVKGIIDNHRTKAEGGQADNNGPADFVDMLLSLQGDSKLDEDDMIAVLWEMIFRGTDTMALLAEWTMAELVANPSAQKLLRSELNSISDPLTEPVLARLPYLQAVIKETLRVHPPGPLLSWARLATADVPLNSVGAGVLVPQGTTAMINMWAIAHDPEIWPDPETFRPERFLGTSSGAADVVDVRGGDLKLAPFGAGRRVCPGKDLGLATVGLWVGNLVKEFQWSGVGDGSAVDFSEVLKLSCEMKRPLVAIADHVHRADAA